MKLKIIKPSRWEVSKNNIVSFAIDCIVNIPEDVSEKIGNDMLRYNYAVLCEGNIETFHRELSESVNVKENMPENKAIENIENKNDALSFLEEDIKNNGINLDGMTRRELINYAKERGIQIDEKLPKLVIKDRLMKIIGGNKK